MLNGVIFASGNGSNFSAIIKAIEDKKIDLIVKLLVCNNKDAYVIERANQANIDVFLIDYSKESSVQIEKRLIEKLRDENINLVILAGFLRKFTPLFINEFPNQIINIHPSLLPKYKGLNAIERALANNDKNIGVSVHYVNENLDDGKIILQESIKIDGLDEEEVFNKVHELEHKLYPNAIKKVIEEVKNV